MEVRSGLKFFTAKHVKDVPKITKGNPVNPLIQRIQVQTSYPIFRSFTAHHPISINTMSARIGDFPVTVEITEFT